MARKEAHAGKKAKAKKAKKASFESEDMLGAMVAVLKRQSSVRKACAANGGRWNVKKSSLQQRLAQFKSSHPNLTEAQWTSL